MSENNQIENLVKTLREAFNSNVEIVWTKGKDWFGTFITIKERKFKIEISHYDEPIQGHIAYAFKFTRWNSEQNKWDMTLTNAGEEHFLVFGTLAKGMLLFIDEIKPDIIFFIGDENRATLYKMLGTRAAQVKSKLYGFNDLHIGDDYIFILSSKNVTAETVKSILSNINQFI